MLRPPALASLLLIAASSACSNQPVAQSPTFVEEAEALRQEFQTELANLKEEMDDRYASYEKGVTLSNLQSRLQEELRNLEQYVETQMPNLLEQYGAELNTVQEVVSGIEELETKFAKLDSRMATVEGDLDRTIQGGRAMEIESQRLWDGMRATRNAAVEAMEAELNNLNDREEILRRRIESLKTDDNPGGA